VRLLSDADGAAKVVIVPAIAKDDSNFCVISLAFKNVLVFLLKLSFALSP
jgi:hypothetical protein